MQTLYSAQQSKQMDERGQGTFLIPGSTLMEDASFSAYLISRDLIKASGRTVFLAGGGNNGGDALAMARLAHLDGCRNIAVMLCDSGRETELRAVQRQVCERLGLEFTDSLEGCELLVDGLFGIGLKGRARAPFDGLISSINAKNIRVISLDVPSGMGDTVSFGCSVKAYMTICMGALKSALYLPQNRDNAGKIECTFPFFPEGAKESSDICLLMANDLKRRSLSPSAYKKSRGSIAIIGGSGRFTGAVVLAAKAAFHAGAGLVTIFTEEKLIPSISKAIPSAMVTTYDDISGLSAFDAVLCGPGMGKNHDNALSQALKDARRLVLDADGIRAFARLGQKAEGKVILTPHLGEYKALLDAFLPEADTSCPQSWLDTLKDLQDRTGASLVVKANTVFVQRSEGTYGIDGQNPSLGVAGSGDVLSGIVAALLGAGDEDADKNGALIHQLAGRLAQSSDGFYSSDDLIRFLGRV